MLMALVLLALGADWGLPDRARVELLLQGHTLTEGERAALTRVRQAKGEEREAWNESIAAKLGQGERVGIFRNEYDADAILTADQKLYAFGSYLLNSGAHDEGQTYHALAAMRPAQFNFDPRMYIYGGSYLYPLGGVLFAMRAVGFIRVTTQYDYYIEHPESIARMYLAGRWMNILAFLGILWLLGMLGEQAGGRVAAALAMASWLVSTQALDQALISKPHLYAAFWSLLAVTLLAAPGALPSRRRMVFAGLAAGWAMGASLPSFLIILPLACFVFDHSDFRVTLSRFGLLVGPMALIFIITNPYILIHFDQFRVTLQGHGTAEGYGYGVVSLGKLAIFARAMFARGYGFPVSLVGLIALPWAALRAVARRRRLAVGVILMILACGTSVAVARIALFIGPFVCLYSGLGLAAGWERMTRRGGAARHALAASGLCLFFAPALFFVGLFFRDTIFDGAWRAPTRAWAQAARLGPQSTIGIFGPGQPHPANLPPFPFLDTKIFNMNKIAGADIRPDYIVVTNSDAPAWDAHSLRMTYHEVANLGNRPSFGWFWNWRVASQSQIAATVFGPNNN